MEKKQSSSQRPFQADEVILERLKEETYLPQFNIGTGSSICIAPVKPKFKLTDSTGTTTINFEADSVTVNDAGCTVLNNSFVTRVAITSNMLFEVDNAVTRDILKQEVTNGILDAINKGYINCDGNTRFNVEIDTSATGGGYYNPLTQTNVYSFNFDSHYQNLTKEERDKLKAKWAAQQKRDAFIRHIKNKQAPAIINHRGNRPRSLGAGANFSDAKPNELVALQLLRSMVDRDVFKKYLKHGFITVDGPSGLTYQVQRKSHIVKVWKQGTLVSTLCIYVKDQHIPPTDDVVAKMLMCLYSEKDIWDGANVSWRAPVEVIAEVVDTIGVPLPTQRRDFIINPPDNQVILAA